jgi:5-methylthioadenosine/S-adenosylhomocysteine deaminase
LDLVDNEVFPLELAHDKFDFLLCELGVGTLRGLVVHLSEGASTDSSAHREYSMLSKEVLLGGIDGKTAIVREGLALIHGSALRDQDFAGMKSSKVGLIWSPRSNDELYGSTTNIASARRAGSPSGSAGMLQEMGYASRRYGVGSADALAMATSMPAKIVRISDFVGSLAPGNLADLVVLDVKVDPTKPNPLDPVTKATPADVALVIVDGKPLYGNKDLLQKLLPAGAVTDAIMVCGAEKAVYLANTEAGKRGWSLADIERALRKALAKGGSSLAEIECN